MESIRGEVLQIPQVREVVELRNRGHLEPGAYVRIAGRMVEDKPAFDVEDLGDAAVLVSDTSFLKANAARLLADMPEGWSGWLGQLRSAAQETAQQQKRNFSLGTYYSHAVY